MKCFLDICHLLYFSMVLHPNQFCVASGQAAGTKRAETAAHIRVWDARSLVTYAILGFGQFQVAVGCLAFSIEVSGVHIKIDVWGALCYISPGGV